MRSSDSGRLAVGHLDWVCVAIYAALIFIGWLNIYASSYGESGGAGIFDPSSRAGMQFIWMCFSSVVALVIVLLDDKYYHMIAYPLYWVAILILIATLLMGKEVAGAKAWLVVGGVAIQPAEFAKFTTALAVSRFMSDYSFSIHRGGDVLRLFAILALPMGIIVLQNDTGSAMVYAAFLLAFYREGMNGWLFGVVAMAVAVFVMSFLLTDVALVVVVLLLCLLAEGVHNGRWKAKIIYMASVALGTMVCYFGGLLLGWSVSLYWSLLSAVGLSLFMVGIYAYRNKLRNIYGYAALFVEALLFSGMVGYIFDNVLQGYQRGRILDVMGIVSDPHGFGYNVNQSKIAIGSGGWFGKGYLNGTQTRYNFVPEQGTDFIFSSMGEEWGFVGCIAVLALFGTLIIRLINMGERQQETFGRIYCYSVASIFFIHVLINVGMVIGIMPVIGIPLPFFSYGGSSLLMFTVLLFVALKMDSTRRETVY